MAVTSASKRFAGVRALEDVSIELHEGSVHALVGENGAGQSTLIKLITGVYPLDSGQVRLRGEEVAFASPRSAQQAGIATIYQEVQLAPQLSVARNFFLGHEPTRFGALNLKKMITDTDAALKRYGMIVADNGTDWYITGGSDRRWNDQDLDQLKRVPGSAFEVVRSGRIRRATG